MRRSLRQVPSGAAGKMAGRQGRDSEHARRRPAHGPTGWPEWRTVILLGLGGLLLRLPPWLAVYPLHRDEGLYGSWARMIVSGMDPALLAAWVDKPPLVPYLLAGSIAAFGASELALRLPGMVAGVLLPLLTYGMARRIGGPRLALLAAALIMLSPFAILFGPTAFTDPWLAVWLVAAAWAALAGRPLPAGLCLGLAIASKQTGLLLAPLILTLLLLAHHTPRIRDGGSRITDHTSRTSQYALRFTLGLVLVLVPVLWWDSLRWPARPSFWARSLDTYGGLGLAAPSQWPERVGAWAQQIGYLFGSPAVTGIFLAFACLGAAGGRRQIAFTNRKRAREQGSGMASSPGPHTGLGRSSALIYLFLAAYTLAYLALHFFVTFQPWDRYLLPLVPLVAILAARGVLVTWDLLNSVLFMQVLHSDTTGHGGQFAKSLRRGDLANCPPIRAAVGAAILAGLLAWPAWLGVSAGLPIGSDHGAYAGLDQVVARVRAMPWDAVVYQRSLGWQLDFYFPGYPPARIWWDDPAVLAEDAEYGVNVFPDRQQWLILATVPDGDSAARARLALAGRGLDLVEQDRIFRRDGTCSFVIYEILPYLAARAGAIPPWSPAAGRTGNGSDVT